MMSSHENLPPQVVLRLAKEVRQFAMNPPDGIKYLQGEDDSVSEIHAEIRGPEATPFEDGTFRMKLVLSEGYPTVPPKGYFLTRIFHPNVSSNGDICVNTLKKDWTPDLGIVHILQVVRCLLIVPFPESSLNDEAGKLFMDSYEEYDRRARLMTRVHAMRKSSATCTTNEILQEEVSNADNVSACDLDKSDLAKEKLNANNRQRSTKKKSLKRL